MHFERAPHAVFRLMMASRSIQLAFRDAPPGWWCVRTTTTILLYYVVHPIYYLSPCARRAGFFQRVRAYQSTLKHSNFYRRLVALEQRSGLAPCAILRSLFAPRCDGCGARFGHRLLRPYAMRLCAACVRAGMISNHTLEQAYGVRLCAFIDAYAQAQLPIVPLDAFGDRLTALQRLSTDPADWRFVSRVRVRRRDLMTHAERDETFLVVRPQTLVFFWRAGVERALLLGGLQDLAAGQAERCRAAKTLSACVSRRQAAACYRARRAPPARRRPQQPHDLWLPGGPFCPCTGRRLGPKPAAERLRALLNKAMRQVLVAGGDSWLPRPPQLPPLAI